METSPKGKSSLAADAKKETCLCIYYSYSVVYQVLVKLASTFSGSLFYFFCTLFWVSL